MLLRPSRGKRLEKRPVALIAQQTSRRVHRNPADGVDLVAGSCVTHLDGAVAVIIENGNTQIAAPIPRSAPVTSAALPSIPIRNPWRDGLESLRSGWLRASRHSRVRRKAPAMAPAAHMLMSPYRALRRAIS